MRDALLSGQPHRIDAVIDDGQLPMLLAVSDNGPQMRSHSTREFLAGVHIAAELERVRAGYSTVRLHAAIGYVTPDDEHDGRGKGIRKHRRDGLERAHQARIDYRRTTTEEQP